MAHWPITPDRENEDPDGVQRGNDLLRREVSKAMPNDPLYGMLADLELDAAPFFLGDPEAGLDYDGIYYGDDCDEMGPF